MNEVKQDCGYTEDYCRRGYGCVLLIAALVSLITSITALALCGAEDKHNDIGSSWVMGILGTLLTFAVTWSIWQVIDTKNTVRKAEETSKRIDELRLYVESTKSSYQSYVFYVDAVRDFDKGEYSNAFLNMASSLETAIEYEISFSRFGRRALDLMDECLDKGQTDISALPDMHIQMVEMLLRQVSKNADYLDLASIRLQRMKSQLESMRK